MDLLIDPRLRAGAAESVSAALVQRPHKQTCYLPVRVAHIRAHSIKALDLYGSIEPPMTDWGSSALAKEREAELLQPEFSSTPHSSPSSKVGKRMIPYNPPRRLAAS